MASVQFNRDLPDGREVRSYLDHVRRVIDDGPRILAALNQISTAGQVKERYGVYPTSSGGSDADTQATTFKNELVSAIGKLSDPNNNGSNTGAQILAAFNQVLAILGS